MKIRRVLANNKQKAFTVETKSGSFVFPYSELGIKPSLKDPLVYVGPDAELGNEAFTYRLKSNKEDTVLLEQVLAYIGDPHYVLEQMLYELTLESQRALKKKRISKRELSRKLKTSPSQLYRLLDQTFYGKTVDQMVRLLHALGKKVEVTIKQAA